MNEQRHRLSQTRRIRLLCLCAGVALIAGGIASEGLAGLLLVMAGLVVVGASIATAALTGTARGAGRPWPALRYARRNSHE